MTRKRLSGARPCTGRNTKISPQEMFTLAFQHHQAGRLTEAEQLYQRIVSIDTHHVDSLHLLGLIASGQGRRDEAISLIQRAIHGRGDVPDFYSNLGILLQLQGRTNEAMECHKRAIALRPDLAGAYRNLGSIRVNQGQPTAAVDCFQHAILLQPNLPELHHGRALALRHLDRLDEAATSCKLTLALKPDHTGAWNNLGNIRLNQGQPEAAIACFKRVQILSPELAEAFNNLGIAELAACRPKEALASFEHAIALKPTYADAYTNAGNALKDQGRHEAALLRYEHALTVQPDSVAAIFDRSLALLRMGQLTAGWADYRRRWQTPKFIWRNYSQPLWDGDPLPSGKLYVWKEQGIGDEIMAAGLIPDLVDRNLKVVLECDPRLVPLFSRSFPKLEVVGESSTLQAMLPPALEIAAHCPGGDLAGYLRPTFQDFARTVSPYLIADRVRRDYLRTRYQSGKEKGPLIGLAWQTRSPVAGRARSLSLTILTEILTVPGPHWISLQYGAMEDIAAEVVSTGIDLLIDKTVDQFINLDDFAAQIAALDLVVTIDNSTAHLAGALGIPVWLFLPYTSDWRWFLKREDSPWYPTLRLFRQSEAGDWAPVLRKIKDELLRLTRGNPPCRSGQN